ncbi:hypothetical protein NDU88_001118, partial [Pleurodeles waltl]
RAFKGSRRQIWSTFPRKGSGTGPGGRRCEGYHSLRSSSTSRRTTPPSSTDSQVGHSIQARESIFQSRCVYSHCALHALSLELEVKKHVSLNRSAP